MATTIDLDYDASPVNPEVQSLLEGAVVQKIRPLTENEAHLLGFDQIDKMGHRLNCVELRLKSGQGTILFGHPTLLDEAVYGNIESPLAIGLIRPNPHGRIARCVPLDTEHGC